MENPVKHIEEENIFQYSSLPLPSSLSISGGRQRSVLRIARQIFTLFIRKSPRKGAGNRQTQQKIKQNSQKISKIVPFENKLEGRLGGSAD